MIERGMDEVEIAGQLEELGRAKGLALVRAQLAPQVPAGIVVTRCIDCDDLLPPVRVAYKWCRCARCQGQVETRAKLMGRL